MTSKMDVGRAILVLTDEFDTHADAVIQQVTKQGGRCVRLNLNVEALRRTVLTISGQTWNLCTGTVNCTDFDIAAVWARRLTVSRTLEQQFEAEDDSFRLWRNEWNRALYGFYAALRERFWINPIQAANLADNKVYQHAVAHRLGLSIPETIISNSKRDLIEFARRYESVALKFMSQDMYRNDGGEFLGLYVNRIETSDLEEFADYAENPVTLQRYVSKAFEVRYTVVADRHFACAIYSQQSKRARIDWRRYDLPNTPHNAIEPPALVREQVASLMKSLDLHFGALDFVVDPDGRWWFLEVNTAGQWLWIEDLTDLPISSAIAQLLVARSREIAG